MSGGPNVIGLTGVPSSGKGEVAAALMQLCEARGWRVAHLSYSDRIKEEARARGHSDEEFERGLLSRIGTELRDTEGPGALSKRIAAKIKSWPAPVPEVFIVEALRSAGEVEALREEFGDRFRLIGVECEPRIIARRLIARQRADEDRAALQSEENAIRLIEKELNGEGPANAPNVGRTLQLADLRIRNNDTLDDLRQTVADFFAELPDC